MKIVAALMIILALVIGIVPQFTSCEAQGRSLTLADGRQIPMKCHWTGQAEIAVAAPLAVTGGFLATSRRKATLRTAGIMGAVLGVFVMMLPTVLIGVCGNPDMICNSVMKPTLIASGGTVTVLSLLGVLQASRGEEGGPWTLPA